MRLTRGRRVVVVGKRGGVDSARTAGRQFVALGFVSGLAIGVLLWSSQQRRHRRGLFSRYPHQRLAALGYLSREPSAVTAQLLRDYVRWEARPVLRRRGREVLRRMEASLQ